MATTPQLRPPNRCISFSCSFDAAERKVVQKICAGKARADYVLEYMAEVDEHV
jgi:hypothetical protein